MLITPEQKRQLRAKSHALKPVVIIGNNGLTANVHEEIHNALEAHELIKIRNNNKDKAVKKQVAEEICQQHNAALINTIGHIITIYRKSQKSMDTDNIDSVDSDTKRNAPRRDDKRKIFSKKFKDKRRQ